MRTEPHWYWKIHRHPIWGTFTTRHRLTAAQVQDRYPGLRAERLPGTEAAGPALACALAEPA